MTIALRQGTENNVGNPVVQYVSIRPGPAGDSSDDTAGAGFLVDPDSLTYRIVAPDESELVASTAVNLTTEKVGVGRFAPTFTIDEVGTAGPNPEGDLGTYLVEWTAEVAFGSGTSTVVRTTPFQLIPTDEPLVDAYATVSDMRDECVPDSGVFTDVRVKRALELGARYIERVTKRFFKPVYKGQVGSVNVDGRGGPILQLDEPIIALEEVSFTFTTFSPTDLPVEQGDLRVYNRHIRDNLTMPDDREDPRIEFLRVDSTRFARSFGGPDVDYGLPVLFARSQQNVGLKGVFGYTDYDGSPAGGTPELIRWANMRLAMKHLRPLFRTSGKGATVAGPIVMEKTRTQQVQYASTVGLSTEGAFTGDSEVDQVLSSYVRPPTFRAV